MTVLSNDPEFTAIKPTAQSPLPEPIARKLVGLFKLLADETRLKILYFLLHEDELNVRALCKRLNQSQPAVSHHLALLRVEGLIDCRRDGKNNFYSVVPARFESLVQVIFESLPNVADRIRFPNSIVSLQPREVG